LNHKTDLKKRKSKALLSSTMNFSNAILFLIGGLSQVHSAIITNDLIKMGVNREGNLNFPGGLSSCPSASTTTVGLRFIRDDCESEATAPGAICEGWGASANGVSSTVPSFSGRANECDSASESSLSSVEFTSTATTATSIVVINGGLLEVTHAYKPSTATPNAYETTVTYKNLGTEALTNLRYRRVMDWDIAPYTFNECVTVDTGSSNSVEFVNDNGFNSADPNVAMTDIRFKCDSFPCSIVDSGPADHGAAFQFLFKDDSGAPSILLPDDTFVFNVFYGAAENKVAADAVLALLGAEVYSYGFPPTTSGGNCDSTTGNDGAPNVFIFAFSGVGGAPIVTPLPTISPSVQGDPHFKTWAGESYDFHGVCDLVLLRNNKFENGLGMDIHTRTSKMRLWSYVSVAAVRVGEDILEVMGGAKENNFWINGVLGKEMISNNNDENNEITLIATISGYPIYFHQVNNKQRTFVIDLGEEEKIVIGTWNSFVRIQFENAKSKHFEGSVGLMGSFSEGIRLARDNITVLEDFNVFGQEWQVLQSERKLFHTIEGPQHPTKCAIPSSSEMRRSLGESQITLLDAKKACVDVNKDVADLCVFDVMATNDEKAVGAY